MPEQTATIEPAVQFKYDLFISYSHKDRAWVDDHLLPRLEGAGFKVCIDHRDFESGTSSVRNMEQGIQTSRHAIVVLTPAWVQSDWANYESVLVTTINPVAGKRKLIPVMLEDCQPSLTIWSLTYRDFRDKAKWDNEWPLLLRDLGASSRRTGELSEKGLKALLELMATPDVRAAVAAFEDAFKTISEQIAVLTAYKTLHDCFQQLERNYEMIVQLQKRAGGDPSAWDELDIVHEPEFQLCAAELLKSGAAAPFAANEALWMATLQQACKELHGSIGNKAVDQLSSATDQINKLLGREPSRLNNSLITTAQNLRLTALVNALTTVSQSVAIVSLEGTAMKQRDEFVRGVGALSNLNLSLASAVRIHGLLQAIYDELYPLSPLSFGNMREFDNAWRYQRIKLQKLKDFGDTDWGRTLCALGDQIEETVTVTRNLSEARRLFQEYRRKTGRALTQADDELLAVCTELQKVGGLVTGVLKGMQHD